ncbi:beta-lactoglobulin isoform X1 [Lemur catta]|uniref:beta-lactoglobulin isoform X1 n=1 Tax=Lemur catta TaxID=9447 RepID=UPI001E26DF39|nr:beta-lactoglobulin isoform X1 [Lemur catta]
MERGILGDRVGQQGWQLLGAAGVDQGQRAGGGAATLAMALARPPLLLLVLGLGLAGAQKTLEEVPVQPGFEAQKVEGRWLTLRLAASHGNLVSPADPLRLSLHSIRTGAGGDVEFLLLWRGAGVCGGENVTVHPTQLPGQYHGSCEYPAWASSRKDTRTPGAGRDTQGSPHVLLVLATGWGAGPGGWRGGVPRHPAGVPTVEGGSMHVRFVSTDYSNLILHVRFEDEEVTSLWVLLARRKLEDPQWLGKYLGYVEKFHLQEAPVSNIGGQCPPPQA